MEPRSASNGDRALFEGYRPLEGAYDEVFEANGAARASVRQVIGRLDEYSKREFVRRRGLIDTAFRRGGITFAVYGDRRGAEKTFPFDPIPRVITAADWDEVRQGLVQRVGALNAFLADIYGKQRILAENLIPETLVRSSKGFLPQAAGLHPPHGVHVHVAGVDLVRRPDGKYVVLEDNVRVPSGVSYVVENRAVMKRIFPGAFRDVRVRSVDEYPLRLRNALAEMAPTTEAEPTIVILTPGRYNSAYFEHSFLARRMGCPLVEAPDLVVRNDRVFVKTTYGLKPVHAIYRRVDDEFLDPDVFREDSLLGAPGLMRAYRAGNVALINSVGNGIADDKAIYPYVPQMIRFYLGQEPILEQVPTYECWKEDDLKYVLGNLERLVVKAVDASGGYGMLIGPRASDAEIRNFADKIRDRPRAYIAQPVVELSTCPTWTATGVAPRRVDLRPYIVTGRSTWVLPGGLTRVALIENSYVVNSSQGGGSKDTWVLDSKEADS